MRGPRSASVLLDRPSEDEETWNQDEWKARADSALLAARVRAAVRGADGGVGRAPRRARGGARGPRAARAPERRAGHWQDASDAGGGTGGRRAWLAGSGRPLLGGGRRAGLLAVDPGRPSARRRRRAVRRGRGRIGRPRHRTLPALRRGGTA